jgi:hypothetical protein
MLATVPNPVVWDGMFHVKVHCSAAAPVPCRGDVNVRVPGLGDASGNYRVKPGATKSVLVDPAFGIGKKLRSVTVRIEPAGEPPSADFKRRLVQRPSAGGGGGGGGFPITHVTKDRRGDGAGALDLRRFTAYVRHRRLVLTWTCWRPFTAAQLDHDTGSVAADIFTSRPRGRARYRAEGFYLRGAPVAKGGSSDFYNPRIRVSRPDRRSVRLSIPLGLYGKPKRVWVFPFIRTPQGEDEAEPASFRVRR